MEEEQETDKSVAVIYRIRRVLRPFNEWLNICESLLENEENGFLNDILKIRYAPVNGERLDYYVDLLFRLCDSMENGSFIGMLVDVVGSIESRSCVEIVEIARFLDKQFQKKSYKELSANNNGSLIESEKCEAYDFDEIVEYIFPRNKPTSADAMLIRNTNIFLIEFKSGFQRKFSEKNFDQRQCQCEETGAICEKYAKLLKCRWSEVRTVLQIIKKAVWIPDAFASGTGSFCCISI